VFCARGVGIKYSLPFFCIRESLIDGKVTDRYWSNINHNWFDNPLLQRNTLFRKTTWRFSYQKGKLHLIFSAGYQYTHQPNSNTDILSDPEISLSIQKFLNGIVKGLRLFCLKPMSGISNRFYGDIRKVLSNFQNIIICDIVRINAPDK